MQELRLKGTKSALLVEMKNAEKSGDNAKVKTLMNQFAAMAK
jgi:hypothetical protein